MSGGPYGRGKAPERACLKIEHWPEEDRRQWCAACSSADLFDPDSGTRAGHSEQSNRKSQVGYGRWLTFLQMRGELNPAVPPVERITMERVYVAHLQELGNSSNTILSRLQELGDVAVAIAPGFDRSPLYRLSGRTVRAGSPLGTSAPSWSWLTSSSLSVCS